MKIMKSTTFNTQKKHSYQFTLYLLLLAVSFLFINNCSLLINESYQNEREIFELFFKDFRSIYAYAREYTGNPEDCSIDDLYSEHSENVSNGMGELALATILISIERSCNDTHFGFLTIPREIVRQVTDSIGEAMPYSYPATHDIPPSPYFNLKDNKLTEVEGFEYGIIESENIPSLKIGYIVVNQLILNLSGSSRLSGNRWWLIKIEDIIKKLNEENVASIILDIRTSIGGSMDNGRFIASRFMNTSGPFIRFAEKTSPNTFQDVFPTVEKEGTHTFTEGKMILLTNKATCSGGEMFALAMRKREKLIQIGYPTFGCAGAILEKDLPNRYIIVYTSSQSHCLAEDPCIDADALGSKTNYFRRGINPDFTSNDSDWMTIDEFYPAVDDQDGKDIVLENAIHLLENDALFNTIYESIERHK